MHYFVFLKTDKTNKCNSPHEQKATPHKLPEAFPLLVFTNFFAAAWSPYLQPKNETFSSRDVSGKEEKYEVQDLETLTSQLTKHHPFG
jgi:hypothetical protein